MISLINNQAKLAKTSAYILAYSTWTLKEHYTTILLTHLMYDVKRFNIKQNNDRIIIVDVTNVYVWELMSIPYTVIIASSSSLLLNFFSPIAFP